MEDYPYKGKSLTPKVARELILELFDKQTDVPTGKIRDTVTEHHLNQGGLPQTTETALPVTNALGHLKTAKLKKADNPNTGYWSLNSDGLEEGFPVVGEKKEDISTVGEGESVVYLYYFPTYRLYAEETGKGSYPCKIGRTEGSVDVRIDSQVGTALPEKYEIGLTIKTDNPVGMEKMIHRALDAANRRIEDVPGQEWFSTNPEQVLEFYEINKMEV